MKLLDRILQNWRIAKAKPFIPNEAEVLDIGCFDGALFEKLNKKLTFGVGIDPLVQPKLTDKYRLINGYFPDGLNKYSQFHAITLLAVLEHIPSDIIDNFALSCYQYLYPKGKLIITVPHKNVDRILEILLKLKLIHGMSLEEHHGFDINNTPQIFEKAGLKLIHKSTFQLGLNNLFVFEKP
ncbi:MAG: methyltransferase domain-containing protein [Bacteroidota bacterium]|nr:methyltransferase domain-containing protein [Bacteroidota bacterium]